MHAFFTLRRTVFNSSDSALNLEMGALDCTPLASQEMGVLSP